MFIKTMKKNIIRNHGFESGNTITFFNACEQYRDGLINRKELVAIYRLLAGGGGRMTQKNQEKQERKAKRKMWTGLYPRKTKTKREKVESLRNKHKGKGDE